MSGVASGGREGSRVAQIFGADLRSLALFRIVLGVLVLADLANRATDLLAHYTDAGVMPREALGPPDPDIFPQAQRIVSPFAVSINMFSGEPLYQALVFLLGAVGAVALIFGWWTRVASVVVWVVMLSIQQRNPLVLASGDVLLRMLLFWAMFLPLGAIWSLDRRRGRVVRPSMQYFSFGTVALFLQIAFIYWFTALLKTGPEWRTDFSALYYALSLDQVARPLGQAMLDFPLLLTFLTVSTLLLEVVGPFLLFSPVFTGPVRAAAVAAFMGLHFGILLTMDIGIFPFISALCMVCFLPAWFWETALPRLRAFLPSSLGNLVRRLGGREDPGEGSQPVTLKPSFVNDLLVLVAFVLVLFWNLTTVSPVGMPTGTAPVALTLGLDQKWNMFAPRPTVDDGWYVIPGTLENGDRVDLMAVVRDDYDAPAGVSWEKPEVVAYMDKNEHWGKYLEFTGLAEYAHQRPYFAGYLCRAWNARNAGERGLENLQIFYMRESTLPDYRAPEIERVRLWDYNCA